MNDRAHKFLAGVLGHEGAAAFKKAISKEESIATAVLPRAILSWIDLATKYEYEGEIPGVENTYLQFRKSEPGTFRGAVSIGEDVYTFDRASVFHVAGAVALALGVDQAKPADTVRDQTLARLGKSIDTIVKARVAVDALKKGEFAPLTKAQVNYDTPEFKAWFRDSKVAHPDGKPMTVYHGTSKDQDFSAFRIGQRGSFFTADPEAAGKYALDNDSQKLVYDHAAGKYNSVHTSPRVIPVHLSLKNPYKMTEADHRDRAAHDAAGKSYARWEAQHFTKVRGMGHDGVDMGGGTWVAFHPHQIKSVFNNKPTDAGHMGKVELPGQSHKPTEQQAAQAPQAPQFQQAQPKPPKLGLKVTKSQAQQRCHLCQRPQFEGHRFVGCLCFSAMAKSVRTTLIDSGKAYALEFRGGDWDSDAVDALFQAMRGR
jgi:hypothetical protein